MGAYGSRNMLLQDLGYESYAAYLSSDTWKAIRRKVLDRDGHKCRCCQEPTSIVHHRKYNKVTLLGTTLDFLIAVCGRCHEEIEFDGTEKRSFAKVEKQLLRLLKRGKKLPAKQKKKPSVKLTRKAERNRLVTEARAIAAELAGKSRDIVNERLSTLPPSQRDRVRAYMSPAPQRTPKTKTNVPSDQFHRLRELWKLVGRGKHFAIFKRDYDRNPAYYESLRRPTQPSRDARESMQIGGAARK